MEIDWALAVRVAVIGFATVAVVLLILAAVLSVAARIINRLAREPEASESKRKES